MLMSRAQLGQHKLASKEELTKSLKDAALRFRDASSSLKGVLL